MFDTPIQERLRRSAASLLVLAAVFWMSPAVRAEEDARDLVRRVLEENSKKPTFARLTMSSGGDTRELETRRMRVDGAEKVAILVTSPYHYKGVRYYFLETSPGRQEHYAYLPTLRRTARISEDARNQPFVGTEFYVADLIPRVLDDYDYRFVGEETVGGRSCRLVESIPKSLAGALYGRSVHAIDPADLQVMRTDFFDIHGKPVKTWTVEKLEKIDDVWTAVEQTMRTADKTVEWRMKVDEINYAAELRAQDFTPVGDYQ